MTDEELNVYIENKKKFFTSPEVFLQIEKNVNELLQTSKFSFVERVCTHWLFELLCFTLHTTDGRELYLKLLNHIAPYCPDIAQKYWNIFDNQEIIKERYRN